MNIRKGQGNCYFIFVLPVCNELNSTVENVIYTPFHTHFSVKTLKLHSTGIR